MAWVVRCLIVVGTITSVFATAARGAAVTSPGSGASIISATCKLKLVGKVGGPDTKDSDYKVTDQGIQELQLACSTVPAGQQIPISVNRTWVTPAHTTGFQGVSVVTGDASCQRATTGQTYIFGLVSFCGSYDLTFSLVDIAGLHVHAPIVKGVDDALAWGLAVVVLGKNVQARVERARVVRNSVLSVFAVKESASLVLGRDVIMTNNRGVWGSCVHAMGSSSVVVNGSTMSHNFAYNSGGSLTARDQSTVLVTGGARISYCAAGVWGGALQADGSGKLTVAGGSIIHNNQAEYGGAGACKSKALIHVKGPRTTMHSNMAKMGGGGVGAQGYATILSTDGAIWRNNSANSGGAAAGQNNVSIIFDSNSLAIENTAQYGGVAAIADKGIIVFRGNTTLMHNRASYMGAGAYGGVAAAQGRGSIHFYDTNVLGNSAGHGGVAALQNQGNMMAYEGSIFSGNWAEQQGGVVSAMELSDVTFNGSRVVNNSAPGGLGGVVALDARTTAVLAGSTRMANNSAANGGALALTTFSTLRLEGACVLEYNTATGDGGAVLLDAGTSLNISMNADSSDSSAHRPRISENTAGDKGGGVRFGGDYARLDPALLVIATGNNAKFDPDISTPLESIVTLSDHFVRLASRKSSKNETLTVVVKLIGRLGVASGGVQVQATLKGHWDAGVLAVARSNVSGVAILQDIKLREKPGVYYVEIKAPDFRNITPAEVKVGVRTCIIGETTTVLGDLCDTCGPGTYSLDPANFTCDSCPQNAMCQGGAQIVPDVGYWSSSRMSPQIHPCPNPAACSGNRGALMSCEVVPSNISTTAASMTVGHADSFAYKCKTNISKEQAKAGGSSSSGKTGRSMLAALSGESTVYMTHADARELLCSQGYSGNLCGHCDPGYGQAAAFTCHPCLPRTTAAVLYGIAFIAALLLVRLLTWLTITDNNTSAAAAVAAAAAAAGPSHAGKAAATAAGQQATTKASTSAVGPTSQQSWLDQRVGHKRSGFLGCFGSSSRGDTTGGDIALNVEDSASEAHPPSPSAVQPAVAKGLQPTKSGTSVQGSGLVPSKSSASVQSATAGAAQSNASSVSPTGGQTGVSYLARASDIFRVLVLYIQYMVIIANLRVSWPVTISYPSKALTWLYSVGSSQALALECLYDVHAWHIPPDIQRQLVYIVMPLAVFLVLLLVELLVRCLILVLTSGVACGGTGAAPNSSSTGSSSSSRPCGHVFEHFGTLTLALFMVTVFFFLPALVRTGLGFLACIPLDDPKATPYAWAGLAPGSYWVAGPNQACWWGWHAKWAWSLGGPLVALLCVVVPISIAVLVWFNRGRLDSPELKRHFGFIYRQYKPNRAAWEAVVIVQTTILCIVAVFGLALGPHYQTLTMAAFCAFNIVMMLAFEPYKHRQQHRVQLFAFTCIFVMCFAALSFIPSYDGKVPPEAYKIAMGAAVLTLNLVFICWALWQLKQCLAAEFRSFWAALGSKISTAKRRVRVFGGRQRVRLQGCFG